jgi:hypothetical protein
MGARMHQRQALPASNRDRDAAGSSNRWMVWAPDKNDPETLPGRALPPTLQQMDFAIALCRALNKRVNEGGSWLVAWTDPNRNEGMPKRLAMGWVDRDGDMPFTVDTEESIEVLTKCRRRRPALAGPRRTDHGIPRAHQIGRGLAQADDPPAQANRCATRHKSFRPNSAERRSMTDETQAAAEQPAAEDTAAQAETTAAAPEATTEEPAPAEEPSLLEASRTRSMRSKACRGSGRGDADAVEETIEAVERWSINHAKRPPTDLEKLHDRVDRSTPRASASSPPSSRSSRPRASSKADPKPSRQEAAMAGNLADRILGIIGLAPSQGRSVRAAAAERARPALHHHGQAATGSGTAEQTLATYSLPANTLTANRPRAAHHGPPSRLRRTATTRPSSCISAPRSISSGVLTTNAKNGYAELIVVRTGSSTQIVMGKMLVDTTPVTP